MAKGGKTRVRVLLKMLQLLQKTTSVFYEQPGEHDLEKMCFLRTTTNGSFRLQRCFPGFVMSQSGPLECH